MIPLVYINGYQTKPSICRWSGKINQKREKIKLEWRIESKQASEKNGEHKLICRRYGCVKMIMMMSFTFSLGIPSLRRSTSSILFVSYTRIHTILCTQMYCLCVCKRANIPMRCREFYRSLSPSNYVEERYLTEQFHAMHYTNGYTDDV